MEKAAPWSNAGAYELYVGRWSRNVAAQFLDWLHVPPGGHWLDVGCGTGALSQAILDRFLPKQVTGIDLSEAYVQYARAHVRDARVEFRTGDARALPIEAASADVAVSGLAVNFVPQPGDAASEMARVVRPGGTVAAYVWDYSEGMQFMRYFWDAAIALDHAAAELDEGPLFPVCRRDGLRDLFGAAGLQRVDARAIEIPTHFRSFEDYWQPFLGAQGPAPRYLASLNEDRRAALKEHLRSMLPAAPDGSIALIARAWAARGER
ncbi:MAG TPA: class I SAM-dependent methyltransferase [Gallionellaceae bacterium]